MKNSNCGTGLRDTHYYLLRSTGRLSSFTIIHGHTSNPSCHSLTECIHTGGTAVTQPPLWHRRRRLEARLHRHVALSGGGATSEMDMVEGCWWYYLVMVMSMSDQCISLKRCSSLRRA